MTAASQTSGWERVVFKLRFAEVAACMGDSTAAMAILAPIARLLGQLSVAKQSEMTPLYIMLRVASACGEVGLVQEAVSTARIVYQGAIAGGDQVFEIESLRILADADTGPERERWLEALAEMEETTDYVKYRRGDRKPVRKPAIDRLYEMLTETFAN